MVWIMPSRWGIYVPIPTYTQRNGLLLAIGEKKEENVDCRHLTTGSSGLAGQARSQLNRMLAGRLRRARKISKLKNRFISLLYNRSTVFNFLIILVSVFGQIPIGFALAYILFRRIVRYEGFFQTMTYLPNTISTIVIGVMFQSFFSPYGAFTQLGKMIDPAFENTLMLNPNMAMIPVLLVILWMYTGYYMIIFLANMQKIDQSVIEACRIDGANEFQTLRYLILPALSGVIVTTAILAISGSLKSFDLIFAMTAGNPARRTSVLSLYMFDNAFRGAPDYPLANAISTFMVVLSFLLIIVVRAVEKRFGGRE